MTITRTQLMLAIIALVGVVALVFMAGRGCSPYVTPVGPEPIIQGIDAGPGEQQIAARLDASVQEQEARMHEIEHKFDTDMAQFDDQQRAQYQQLRDSSLEDAAAFLSQWARSHRDAGTGT